ncbi:Zinc finger protein 618 [Frankliniella fusca]|uniref:Zinc finger protein 618 n=1 Tax=Frankliniella fusca TaxID=407009 RepID=A0AAE1I479_9NEOP|nr:Zinc finger protein 618 [Frankliniella fusca]
MVRKKVTSTKPSSASSSRSSTPTTPTPPPGPTPTPPHLSTSATSSASVRSATSRSRSRTRTPSPASTSSTTTTGELEQTPTPTALTLSKRAVAMAKLDSYAKQLALGTLVIGDNKKLRAAQPGDKFDVWQKLDFIMYEKTGIMADAVQCKMCKTVLSYNVNTTGNSHLTNHVRNSCKKRKPVEEDVFTMCSPDAKSRFIDKMADACALTLTSMNHITNEVFVELFQLAIDIGHKVGRVDARELVPAVSTLSQRMEDRASGWKRTGCGGGYARALGSAPSQRSNRGSRIAPAAARPFPPADRAEEARGDVMKRAIEAIEDGRCRCSTDMWTEEFNSFSYIDVHAYFSNQECTGEESHFLVMAKMPYDQPKTGTNIRNALFRALNRLGLSAAQFEKIEWVTDRGANIKKALENVDGQPALPREDCVAHRVRGQMAHLINTIVRGTLSYTHLELRQKAFSGSDTALQICDDVAAAARKVKSAKHANVSFNLAKLQESLHLATPHLRSYCKMLQSVVSRMCRVSFSSFVVQQVLVAIGEPHIPYAAEQLQDIIEFLAPLDNTGQVPAANLRKIRLHLVPQEDESQVTLDMKGGLADDIHVLELLEQVNEARQRFGNVPAVEWPWAAARQARDTTQEVETRWNSMCTMLESVVQQYVKIMRVLRGVQQQKRLKGIKLELLQWLVAFLKPFRDETTELEANHYPTLPLVLPTSVALQEHCQPQLLDNVAQEAMRKRALKILGDTLKPTLKQKVATFLVPVYRHLVMIEDEDERKKVFDYVRTKINGQESAAEDEPDQQQQEPEPEEPPRKRPRRIGANFQKWKASGTAPKPDEVSAYLQDAPDVDIEDVFPYWKAEAHPVTGRYPKLAKLAHQELGKPATSAGSERGFSRAGFLIQARRNRLSPKTIDNILFLNSYLRNKMMNNKK